MDTEDPVIPEDPGTAEDPAQNPEQPTGNEQNIEKGKPAKTGDSANVALPIVCAAIAGCAAVYAGLRMKRRKM